jgi:hypothetical protein
VSPASRQNCDRPVADQQHVRRAFHDRTRRENRVARPENAGDRAGAAVAPVHHRGVHLLGSGAGEHRAASGIEQRVVLERDHRFGHRVERAAAARQDVASGGQRAAEPCPIKRRPLGGHRAALATCRRRHGWRARSRCSLSVIPRVISSHPIVQDARCSPAYRFGNQLTAMSPGEVC